MRLLLLFLVSLVVMLMQTACRSTKKIQTAIATKDTTQVVVTPPVPKIDSVAFINEVYAAVQKNQIDFNTFSAKIKVDFEDKDGKKSDFNAFVRLKKDSALWISINAALGIEAFRVLITKDSVKVLNKLDKVVQLRSVGYLQEVAGIPFTFSELQDLLVGNPIYFGADHIHSFRKDDKVTSLYSLGPLFRHLLTVRNGDYLLQNSKIDDLDPAKSRTMLIVYGDYETKGNIRFSTYRKISITQKNNVNAELQFKQFSFNEELNIPFTIPKNYKRE
jgi:hypothetical protein